MASRLTQARRITRSRPTPSKAMGLAACTLPWARPTTRSTIARSSTTNGASLIRAATTPTTGTRSRITTPTGSCPTARVTQGACRRPVHRGSPTSGDEAIPHRGGDGLEREPAAASVCPTLTLQAIVISFSSLAVTPAGATALTGNLRPRDLCDTHVTLEARHQNGSRLPRLAQCHTSREPRCRIAFLIFARFLTIALLTKSEVSKYVTDSM